MTDAAAVRTALAGDYVVRHPGEVAALLEKWSTADGGAVLERTPLESATPVFAALTPAVASDLLARAPVERAVGLLRGLDPAHAAALCARLATELQDRLLDRLPEAEARELRELMTYPADSAAALMTTRVPTFRPAAAAVEILARLRAERAAGVTDVALVDSGGRFAGMVPVVALAAADAGTPALQLARTGQAVVPAMTPREDVVDLMARTHVATLPVVDAERRLLGVVGHDERAAAIEAEATASAQTMVGASEDERALSPIGFAVRKRLPWLQVNLLTAFLAAAVVGVFEATIAQVTALAVLLPVVAGAVRQHRVAGARRDHSRTGAARGTAAALAPGSGQGKRRRPDQRPGRRADVVGRRLSLEPLPGSDGRDRDLHGTLDVGGRPGRSGHPDGPDRGASGSGAVVVNRAHHRDRHRRLLELPRHRDAADGVVVDRAVHGRARCTIRACPGPTRDLPSTGRMQASCAGFPAARLPV